SGFYTVTLLVSDGHGNADVDSVVVNAIEVIPTFASSAKGKIYFPPPGKLPKPNSTSMRFTVVAQDLILTPQQSRDAIKDGTYEGRIFQVRAKLPNAAQYTELHEFTVNRQVTDRRAGQIFKA